MDLTVKRLLFSTALAPLIAIAPAVAQNAAGQNFTSSAAVTPASVAPAASASIVAHVKDAGPSIPVGLVDLEIYNASSSRVAQRTYIRQAFSTGTSRTYTWVWTVPKAPGAYTVKIGVFSLDWSTLYYWNDNAATFSVTGTVAPPPAPSGLSAKAGNGQVTLAWSAAAGAATYKLQRAAVSGGPYTSVATGIAGTSYTDTTVTNGTTYFYVAAGVNSGGASPNSNEASATPTAPPSLPAAPGGLTATGQWVTNCTQCATGGAMAHIVLSWTAVTGAASYNIYRNGTLLLGGATTTQYTDMAVTSGQSYSYTVSAVNSAGEGSQSTAASATAPSPPAAPPAAPTGLTAAGQWVTNCTLCATGGPMAHVVLNWNAVAGATGYNVYRGGASLSTNVQGTQYIDMAVTSGQTYTYTVTAIDSAGESPQSASASTTAPSAPISTASGPPTGLTAMGQWVTSCPLCNGPMAHIVVNWNAVSGATGYNIYRNGATYQSNVQGTQYTDMAVTSGQTYTYTVTTLSSSGESAQSSRASATAPFPPASGTAMVLTPPSNLRVRGLWQTAAADSLTWDSAPGAASYNVYRYNTLIAAGVTGTSYLVLPSLYMDGETYSITSVDSMGMESIPSAIVTAQGAPDPTQQPGWTPGAPTPPQQLQATPEWNLGKPRIRLVWKGTVDGNYQLNDYTYNVYRDGKLVALGLWGLSYIDSNLAPGETHTYSVSGVNLPWKTPVESAACSPVTATALSSAPLPASTPVQITGTTPDDDSVLVSFAAVPGAADYRVYSTDNPGNPKYSGGSLSIQLNGLDPSKGADLVVEAVDKMGPFQTMDGAMGPGAMQMGMAINGQGDPSNVPIVLARSAVFHVNCQPTVLSGSQVFFDNFRSEQPLLRMSTMDPRIVAANLGGPNDSTNTYLREYQNNRWVVREYLADVADTAIFFDHNHFMDTLYDGGTPGSDLPVHNNNASLVLSPKATADITGGVLHVTFEVDGHLDNRRWIDVFVTPAGEPLLLAGKFAENNQLPTSSGNLFRLEVHSDEFDAQVFGQSAGGALIEHDITNTANGVGPDSNTRITWDGKPIFNGTTQDLDKRHRFDLYLSANRFRIAEQGITVRDLTFPAGVTLPFTKCNVYFVHQLYHTANDRDELVSFSPNEPYWYNYRPWADERHWDNMGFEVLPGFPQ